ncbi:MAG: hypothetical protein U9O97_01825 [Elusimicrobiota bacterium]|nr:hypothetical protein [Elusimicrobiota bacterium]
MKNSGFALTEAGIILVYISVAVVAMSALIVSTHKAAALNARRLKAVEFASGLLEEVLSRRWKEKGDPAVALGCEDGEDDGDKNTFDDVDDFNGWEESPLLFPAGAHAPDEFPAYSRRVSVVYIDSGDIPSVSPTPFKKITVSVFKGGVHLISLSGQRSDH